MKTTRLIGIGTGLAALFIFGSVVHAGGPGKKRKGSASKKDGPVATTRAPTRPRTSGVASPNAVRAKAAGELVYGEAIRFHNLSVVPVGTTRKGPFQKYTLLEKGLKAKTLAVRELNGRTGDAQVPAVEVRNKGRYPVYLLGGEMILGGKQDRIIQRDTVIENNNKWTKVSVFCVESGRWRGQNMRFKSGGALAHVALRKAAMSGNQSAVWAEVARKNIKHGTQSSTSTYRRTIQNAKLRAKIAPYRKELVRRLPSKIKMAGLVFAINGKIRVADLFGNPTLYKDLQDKLVSAYILEALGQQVVRNAPSISKKAAKQFLYKARRAQKKRLKGSGRSLNYRMESDSMIGAETYDKKGGGKMRETYISK